MNYVKTVFLLVVLSGILMGIGGMIGGAQGAFTAFLIALAINGASFWFSDKIVLTMYRAKELSKQEYASLYKIVENLSREAEIPCPKIYMADINVPNAFATGRNPAHAALCVTKGIMDTLGEEELKGVISHELAHIVNRDTLIMTLTAVLASAIMMIANMARWAAFFGGNSRERKNSGNLIGILAVTIIAPFAAVLVQLAISRSREYIADAKGAKISRSPEGLARALEKLAHFSKQYKFNASPETAHLFIINPLKGNFLAGLFSTHPPVEERIKKLREMV